MRVDDAGLNPSIPRCTPELECDRWGDVVIDSESLETSIPKVWAAGDLTGGEGTVIAAAGEAKHAARNIHKYLQQL